MNKLAKLGDAIVISKSETMKTIAIESSPIYSIFNNHVSKGFIFATFQPLLKGKIIMQLILSSVIF